MVNRDRHDITFEILVKAKSGKNKTELMQGANLSYSLAKKYLSALMSKGLLEIDAKQHLKTTKRGLTFLEKCEVCPLFKWIRE